MRRGAIAALVLVVLLLAWLLWPSGDGPGNTRIAIVGQDLLALKLDAQVNETNRYWKRFEDRDAPEGAYLGWMLPGAKSLPARVPLRRMIEPGKYFVFLKGINYDRPIGVKFSLGGGKASTTTNDADDNAYWTGPVPITVDSATDELSFSLERSTKDPGSKEKLLLRGLYLTTDPAETVLASDRVVALDYPKKMDDSAARPGNIVENGSFEVGLGHGWGSTDDRTFDLASIWDPESGKHGRASLKLPIDPTQSGLRPEGGAPVAIVSKVYAVAPNKRHTLSVWLKSEDGAPAKGQIELINSFGPPSAPELKGKRGQHVLRKAFAVGKEWTRVDLTGYLLRYPTADYHVKVSAEVARGRHLWVDAVSLNEGGPKPFASRAPLEIGLRGTQSSNLFYEDEPLRMTLRAYNAGARDLKRTVRYEIYDHLNRRLRAGKREVDVPKGSVDESALDLDAGRRGSFRVVMWVEGEEGSEEEVIYGVVPRPQRSGRDEGSLIGSHSNFSDWQYDAMSRLGIKWDRALSPGRYFRWSVIEPEDDEFIWYDSKIDRARERGISVLGTLGTNDHWPKWADDGGKPDLDKWEEFVGQVVRHYRGGVKTWEIWNEPNSLFEPAFYARMLKRGAEAVRRADPSASVVAMGGPSDHQYIRDVFAELRKQFPKWQYKRYIDVLSMHMYPNRVQREAENGGRAAVFNERVLTPYGLPLWNTETGEEDTGFYRTSNAVYERWGPSLFGVADAIRLAGSSPSAIEKVSTTFLETIGNGLSKIFYYDFRVGAATPTWTKSSHSMLEYDDTIRPKGIAYAVLARLFDHSRGMGTIKLGDAGSQAFLFDRGGVALAGLYTIDGRPRTLKLSGLRSNRFRVFDSMGNRVPAKGGSIDYGPTPVYIEGRGITPRELERAFRRGEVSDRKDTQAPAATIDEAPRGPISSSSLRVRFSATDDTAVPSFGAPTAITYSHRLVQRAGRGAWSSWSPRNVADFEDLGEGRHDFELKARDAAGNVSTVVSRPIDVR